MKPHQIARKRRELKTLCIKLHSIRMSRELPGFYQQITPEDFVNHIYEYVTHPKVVRIEVSTLIVIVSFKY